MSPKNLNFEDCDISTIYRAIERGTQTSSTSVPDKGTAMDKDNDSTTVFEICHVEQDPYCPKSITIVKETVSKEIHKHDNCENDDEVASHRYVYKKEVIEPYMEPSPGLDCKTKDELVAAALSSAIRDFPDYKHCLQMPGGQHDCPGTAPSGKPNAVTSIDPSAIIVSMIETSKKDKSSHSLTGKCSSCSAQSQKQANAHSSQSNIAKKCDSVYKSVENVTKLVRSSLNNLLTGQQSCPKKPVAASDMKDEACTHQHECRTDEPRESCGEEASRGARVKAAVGGLVCRMYQSTHDAVATITTQSSKQIEKLTKCKSDECTANDTKPVETHPETTKSEEDVPDNKKEGSVCSKLMEKMNSGISSVSKRLRRCDSSHDEPTPPREVSHVLRPDLMPASSMFTTLKSTLFWMFHEASAASESTSTSSLHDSDEESDANLINKFID